MAHSLKCIQGVNPEKLSLVNPVRFCHVVHSGCNCFLYVHCPHLMLYLNVLYCVL